MHLFCECDKVSPLWDELCFLINNISGETFNFSNFDKMFGITDISEHDNCINFLFLCMKFYDVIKAYQIHIHDCIWYLYVIFSE